METTIETSKSILLDGKTFEEIISTNSINNRIDEIALDISNYYKNKKPVIVGVLNGAFIFMADLIRKLNIQYEVDFIKISSYNNDLKSSGNIKLDKDLNINLKNRHVIVIEDIVDTGLSIEYLYDKINESAPASIKFASLLYKNTALNNKIKVDWIGFNIDDRYVIGYGLDFKQYYRGLDSIYAAKER